MNVNNHSRAAGRVVSLHLHPREPGEPLTPAESIEVIADKGISGEPRYFGRMSRDRSIRERRQKRNDERVRNKEGHRGG